MTHLRRKQISHEGVANNKAARWKVCCDVYSQTGFNFLSHFVYRHSLSFLQATSINVAKAICFSQIGPLAFFSNGGMAVLKFRSRKTNSMPFRTPTLPNQTAKDVSSVQLRNVDHGVKSPWGKRQGGKVLRSTRSQHSTRWEA